ncbi:MAG: hypothetical protein F6K17_15825 [Okeania sp. SIO3C4]|nr:hypothetical protein [Okeania sp. SIO3C4]
MRNKIIFFFSVKRSSLVIEREKFGNYEGYKMELSSNGNEDMISVIM